MHSGRLLTMMRRSSEQLDSMPSSCKPLTFMRRCSDQLDSAADSEATHLRAVAFNADQLSAAGANATQLPATGFNSSQRKSASVDATQLRAAGSQADQWDSRWLQCDAAPTLHQRWTSKGEYHESSLTTVHRKCLWIHAAPARSPFSSISCKRTWRRRGCRNHS